MLENFLLGLAIFAYAFWLPGLGVARRWFPEVDGIERFTIALGVGSFGISFLSFVFAAVTHLWLTPAVVLGVATVVNGIHLWGARDAVRAVFYGTRPASFAALRPTRAGLRVAVFGVLLPWILFAQNFTLSEFVMNCVNFAPAYVTGMPVGDHSILGGGGNEILGFDMEQREGNVALISAYPALYDFAGYRVFFATTNLIAWLFAFCLGRHLFGRAWQGWVFAGVLLFNGLTLGIREIDQNLITLAGALGSLYFLVVHPNRSFMAGLFFAFAWGARHILVLGVGGLLLGAFMAERRKSAVAWVLLGLTLPSLYFMAHHYATSGELVHHESFRHFPLPIPHRILGMEFDIHTILAWPFTGELARSPFAAQPSLTLYSMLVPVHLGTVFLASWVLGAIWLVRSRPLLLGVVLAMGLPPLAMLMVQGNWTEPDKVRIALVALGPLCVPFVAGLELMQRSRWWIPAVLVAGWAMIPPLEHITQLRFPVDAREYIGRPDLPVEGPGDHEFVRSAQLRGPRLLPRVEPNRLFGFFHGEALAELRDPSYEAREAPMSYRITELIAGDQELLANRPWVQVQWQPLDPAAFVVEATRILELDVSRPFTVSSGWAREVDEPTGLHIDLVSGIEDVVRRQLSMSAFDHPVDLAAVRWRTGGQEVVFVVLVRRPAAWIHGPEEVVPGDRISLEISRDAMVVIGFMPSIQPMTFLGWDLTFEEDGSVAIAVGGH